MLKFFLILALLFQDSTIALTSPTSGEILRGMVEIQGRMDAPNFTSAELAFTYSTAASDPAAAWFTLQTFSQPTAGPVLTAWDTTTVTDGDYDLRLRVNFQDGTIQDILITDLKIRNDEPLPTPTPTATLTATPTLPSFSQFNATLAPPSFSQETPTPITTFPTATPLPTNPATLTVSSIFTIFWQSAALILSMFAFFSLILRLRKNI
ncbi:MAG: hypothetical protein JNK32_08850 [Anaerolineales bacterium]|nr:hypothetical protein [Anaerolineales bacterium]